ncbi:hypothetical protein OR263_24080 [Streptomyces sp. NEAU-H22]|uniref:hypothetical protein n=1 Tax=unclassified Streptomyces TaxID=2593676 RepID=UPI00225221CA|nr:MULTISPECIES: hypothetical protein [unclassified Streptomyces]MCX3289750.1 hypothetical protein [Streptomyces sp. NEAU-H22]WMD06435.1 hypothetical protein Q7C01_19480 [Streptomyces sp. FXY-T5]
MTLMDLHVDFARTGRIGPLCAAGVCAVFPDRDDHMSSREHHRLGVIYKHTA